MLGSMVERLTSVALGLFRSLTLRLMQAPNLFLILILFHIRFIVLEGINPYATQYMRSGEQSEEL